MGFDLRASLWEQKKKDEQTGKVNVFLSGVCNKDIRAGERIFVFKAKTKKDDKSPDFYVNVSVGD